MQTQKKLINDTKSKNVNHWNRKTTFILENSI